MVVASLLVHAIFIALLCLIPQPQREEKIYSADEFTYLPEEKPANEAVTPQNQVVQSTAGQKADQAKDHAYLGERTQVVERETASKNPVTSAAKAPQPAKAEQKAEAPKQKVAQQAKPAENEATPDRHPVKVSLDKLGVALPAPGGRVDPNRTLSQDRQPAQEGAVAGANDFVKGIKESDRTALNTQEFVFFGYFQRIRERLDQSWGKSLREELGKYYKKGRTLASEMDHVTRVLVTLNSSGSVTRVQVLEDSGTEDLDTAAVDAFNNAGPFPNPPKGMLNATGEIKIRWDFILRT